MRHITRVVVQKGPQKVARKIDLTFERSAFAERSRHKRGGAGGT